MQKISKMKLIQFNGFKTLAVIVILLVSLIYYHNLFKFFAHFEQRLNGTETTKSLAHLLTESQMTTSKRIKRFLIFQGGGVVKLVFGTSFPIMLSDKKRSMNYFYNFQMQYTPPTIPLHWWSFLNTTTFAARTNIHKRAMDKLKHYDKSRTLAYEFMEAVLERSRNKGNDCILKMICELARAPLVEDFNPSEDNDENKSEEDYGQNIFHKLLNAIFTPMYSNVNERYLNARAAGQNGANCGKTFGECPVIDKWLQKFTQLY